MAERGSAPVRRRSCIAVLAVIIAATGCTPMDDLLSGIFGRNMRDQPSIGPYENPLLPPQGAVPFAAGNFPASPEMFALGQPEGVEIPPPVTPIQLLQQAPEIMELINPVAATEASLARGEEVYNRACVPCHGLSGAGDGLVTEAGVPSFSILAEPAVAYPDGYIYTLIRIGRGAMPAYGHQVTHFDRWNVVNYVRQLQGQ